jgi:hypothetical protein
MDSIRLPLQSLERFDPPGVQSPPAGTSDAAQAPMNAALEPVAASGGKRFEGDGGDVLAMAASYAGSAELDTATSTAVSSIIDHLGIA